MRQQKQKNLIFVFADQWRGSAMGFAGEDPVVTPNMDRFCREGVYFTNACSTFPLCTPHRASLLTGRYPLSMGMFTNCKTGLSMRLGDEETGIGQVLKAQGYRTAYIGKWHLDEPERNRDEFPLSGACSWDAYTPPGVRRHGFDFWYSYGAWDAHLKPHYWKNDPEMISVSRWSPEEETDVAIGYIKENREEAFALYLSYNPPHSPYDQVPECYLSQYGHINLRKNVTTEGLCHHTGEEVLMTQGELEETTRQYFAAITGLDHQFGRLIETLTELGLYEDTVIVLSSDHGDMMGSHGLMGKHVWFEESVRIPFVVRVPGVEPGIRQTCLGSQDMMPTVLGILGIEIPKTVEGVDCSLALRGEEDREKVCFLCACPGRDVFLKAFEAAGKNPAAAGWRGVRTGRYTYVIDTGYGVVSQVSRHLYDNWTDPLQEKELDLEKPEQEQIAQHLEAMVLSWVKGQKDGFRILKEEIKHERLDFSK